MDCSLLSCNKVRALTLIYTLSLHDALPILRDSIEKTITADYVDSRYPHEEEFVAPLLASIGKLKMDKIDISSVEGRSEEHTSELQSHSDLVCRLLLEKKNRKV